MTQANFSDTHPDIDRLQVESLRRLSEADRLNMTVQLSSHVWGLARRAFAERYPEESPDDQLFHFLVAQYGEQLASCWRSAAATRGQK